MRSRASSRGGKADPLVVIAFEVPPSVRGYVMTALKTSLVSSICHSEGADSPAVAAATLGICLSITQALAVNLKCKAESCFC